MTSIKIYLVFSDTDMFYCIIIKKKQYLNIFKYKDIYIKMFSFDNYIYIYIYFFFIK